MPLNQSINQLIKVKYNIYDREIQKDLWVKFSCFFIKGSLSKASIFICPFIWYLKIFYTQVERYASLLKSGIRSHMNAGLLSARSTSGKSTYRLQNLEVETLKTIHAYVYLGKSLQAVIVYFEIHCFEGIHLLQTTRPWIECTLQGATSLTREGGGSLRKTHTHKCSRG